MLETNELIKIYKNIENNKDQGLIAIEVTELARLYSERLPCPTTKSLLTLDVTIAIYKCLAQRHIDNIEMQK